MKLSSFFKSPATNMTEPAPVPATADNKVLIKQPPVLFEETQAVMAEFEKTFGAPLITYWNNARGSVCDNDVVVFHELLERIGEQK